jgi:predicted ArsR family transcriptional regulator
MANRSGSQQRDAILGALRDERAGLDANALAERLGLHPNTVRWHLGVLADTGLVDSRPEQRSSRGRPSIVYRLTPDGVAHDRDEYRLLATMLTVALASEKAGEARAYETGRAWGRELVAEPDPERAVDAVVELLDEQGFAAEVEEGTISMRRCPFYALAASNPEVICTLHHGLIDGALEAAGGQTEVESLEPFVEPTLCIARLRQRERSTAAATKSSAR